MRPCATSKKNNLQKEIWSEKIRDAEEFLEKAKQTGDGTKIELAEKELNEIKKHEPTRLEVKDYIYAIKKEIIKNNAGEDAVKQLTLFLASDTSTMAPSGNNGKRLYGVTNSHVTCNVSADGSCTVNQTFENVRDFSGSDKCSVSLGIDTKGNMLQLPLREVWR